jgi:hypothetical protein
MPDFIDYHKQHPEIWVEFVQIAIEKKAAGFKTFSAKGIFEVIRWRTQTISENNIQLSNQFTPDYARKLMNEHPSFQGFFELRPLTAKRN